MSHSVAYVCNADRFLYPRLSGEVTYEFIPKARRQQETISEYSARYPSCFGVLVVDHFVLTLPALSERGLGDDGGFRFDRNGSKRPSYHPLGEKPS